MDGRKVSRRQFIIASALMGTAAVVAACGATPTPAATTEPQAEATAVTETPTAAPAAAETVLLQHWQSDWGKDWNEPMIRISDAFTRDAMPNVEMEWTFLPNVSEKLLAAVAGGNPPDVCTIDEDYGCPKVARAGGLLSLDAYYKRDGVKGEDFIPFTWVTTLYKGEPYGIPGGCNTTILHYVKDVLDEVGLGPDLTDTPKWSEFADWSQKLLKRDASGKIERIGYKPNAGVLGRDWAGILGVTYYNDDLTQLLVDSPETINALSTYAKLMPEGISVDDISTFLSGAPDSSYGSWGAGMEALITECYSGYFLFDMYWPDLDWGQAKLPTPNGSKDEWALYTGWVWDPTIPKGAQHPDEAWAFMKYGYWEHGEMVADTINWTSSLKALPAFMKHVGDVIGQDNRQIPYLHHFQEIMYAAKYYVPYTPIYSQLRDAMGQATDKVLRSMATPEQALAEVKSTMQPELDKVNAEDWR